jgi:polysaccharide biosynthesis transport protein
LPTLFERLSGEYDFILVDSAPLFSSDATELLVTLAHVVVLVAQGDRTMLRDFARTTELILRLEIPAMAAVLNWGGIRPLNWFDGMVAKIPFPMVRQVMQRLNEMGNRV